MIKFYIPFHLSPYWDVSVENFHFFSRKKPIFQKFWWNLMENIYLNKIFINPSKWEWFNALETHHPNLKTGTHFGSSAKDLDLGSDNCRECILKLIFGQETIFLHIYLSHLFHKSWLTHFNFIQAILTIK